MTSITIDNKLLYLFIPLIRELLKFNYPTDKLLSNFFRENKKLTSKQRELIAETSYAILRNYYKLTQPAFYQATTNDNNRNTSDNQSHNTNHDNILQHNIPDIIGLTWLNILNIPSAQLSNLKLIDSQRLSKINFLSPESEQLNLELPSWIVEQLSKQYDKTELKQLALSLQQPAPLDLRVNLIKNNVNDVLKELQQFDAQHGTPPKGVPQECVPQKCAPQECVPQKMPYSPFGIRLEDKTFLAKHPLFTNGSIEVQDEASQLAGLLLNPKRGEMIVDFCAGSGGKTLLFGMLMRNSGRIYAFDVNEKRLNNLYPRLARSGLSNVYPQLINNETDNKVKRLHNKIDRVFVDAPCSGLGTLRRNPELKFRQSPDKIAELNLKQMSILEEASKLVKPGGHLVYATCSILPQENQLIVEKFLNNHPEFKLIPAATVIKNPQLEHHSGCLVLLPHIHHCDGFFAALFMSNQ
ncbi:MAG: rRNA (cytosine967-C5)-methyltransferase [Pseudomonadota bacterium]|nr:rRNA (cytosine967-C5)-methyltransferase [Pseudomonadota bacterium]